MEQSRATWFSKKGGNLLYATFNATSVGEVTFKLYGDETNDLGTNFEENSKSEPNLYGKIKSLRYPKVRIGSSHFFFLTIYLIKGSHKAEMWEFMKI